MLVSYRYATDRFWHDGIQVTFAEMKWEGTVFWKNPDPV